MTDILVHESGLLGVVESCSDSILCHQIHNCTIARIHVPITGCSNYLMQFLPKLISLHTLSVVSLTNGDQLLRSSSCHFEPLDHALSPDGVITG